MKKIYFAPKTEIVKVKTDNLLNVVSGGSGDVTSVTESGDEFSGDSGDVLSRRGSIWDDEE